MNDDTPDMRGRVVDLAHLVLVGLFGQQHFRALANLVREPNNRRSLLRFLPLVVLFMRPQVERKADITMPELAAVLQAERDLEVDPSKLSKFLIAQGYSYKKNSSGQGARTPRREAAAR